MFKKGQRVIIKNYTDNELIGETGPAHDKRFKVRVLFDGIELGTGEGSTKKEAEQLAAKAALEKEASK